MKAVRATVPVRIDLAGGTLDIWPLHLALPRPGVTVNAALDVPARADVVLRDDRAIELVSDDLDARRRYDDLDALRAGLADAGPLALLALAVSAAAPDGGLTLRTRATSPAGAGLGGSSALLGAVLGALFEAKGAPRDREALRALGQDIETALLKTPTGYQDYYPPLYGGCLALEGGLGGIEVEPLPVDLATLERRLRLVYTGEPHHSGMTNWGTVRAYLEGEAETVEALHEIAENARVVRSHLRAARLDEALAGVLTDGGIRRRMAPGVTTPTIESLDAAVRERGALGTKILGAGGGGCVLVLLPDDERATAVDAYLAGALPGDCLAMPLLLSESGLTITHTDPTTVA